MEFPSLGLSDENFVTKMMQSNILHRTTQHMMISRHEMEQLAEPLLSLSAGFAAKRKHIPEDLEKGQEETPAAFMPAKVTSS